MKHILMIFVLIIFAACEKESSECYTCHIRTVKSSGGTVMTDETIKFDKCDATASEILDFETDNTETWTEIETTPIGTQRTVKYEKTCDCL
jgi:hypothetical protein